MVLHYRLSVLTGGGTGHYDYLDRQIGALESGSLDAVLLMIPLKMLMVGIVWQLGIAVFVERLINDAPQPASPSPAPAAIQEASWLARLSCQR